MKKQLLILVACSFLASCTAGHEHTYSGEWTSDTTNHWHAATCEHTDEKSDSAAHTFGEWSEKTAPTYDAAGVDHRTCSVCNFEETRAGAVKLEHNYATVWTNDANKHWHACTDAGFESLKKDEANHVAGDWEVTKEATVSEKGSKQKKCTVCNAVVATEEIPMLDHNYASTWTSDANKHWHACTDAGYTNLKKDEANHTPGEWVVTKQATFTEKGSKEKKCTVCNAVVATEEILEKAHNYATEWTTNETNHWHACTDAGYTELKSNDAAHTAGDWVVTKEATFTETGSKQKSCTVCNKVLETEEIAVKEHSYSNTWSSDANNHWHACTDVGFDLKTDEGEHTFGEWTTTKAAGYLEKGSEKRTCNVCSYEDTRDVEQLDINTLPTISKDGIYTVSNIENKNANGMNTFADGIYVFGSSEKALTFGETNVTTPSKSYPTGPILVFRTSGSVKMTFRGASGKKDTECTFGFYDGLPNSEANNFNGKTYTSSTQSNIDCEFVIPSAGTYYFGSTKALKISSIKVELHDVDLTKWAKDESGHWNSGDAEECLIKENFAEHTFGDWVSVDETNDKKVCSVCSYEVIEAKSEHAGCEHTYVAGVGTTSDKIKYTCSKCGEYYENNYSVYVANPEGQTSFSLLKGNTYTVDENAIAFGYKGSDFASAELAEAKSITGADGQTISITKTLDRKKAIDSYNSTMSLPGACKIIIHFLPSSGNFRILVDGSINQNYTDEKGNILINGAAQEKTAYNIAVLTFDKACNLTFGTSSSTGATSIYAIEVIY